MGTTIGHETIRTLIDHGVIAPKPPSEPKPTLAALFATAVDRKWSVHVTPLESDDAFDGFGKPKEPPVAVDVETLRGRASREGMPLLPALAEAVAEALSRNDGTLDTAI